MKAFEYLVVASLLVLVAAALFQDPEAKEARDSMGTTSMQRALLPAIPLLVGVITGRSHGPCDES